MREARSNGPYTLFILALSAYALLALAIDTLVPMSPETRQIFVYSDNAVCLLFFVDFLLSLARAEHRGRYFLQWGWLDLLSSIPMVKSLRWGRAARILRIIRVLRGLRATRVMTEFLLGRRAEAAFLAAFLITFLMIFTSAIAVLQFETAPQANIRTAEDALWWAVATVTTVGYGDRFPITSEGRLVAALLMAAGVGLFGTLSGFVASWFLQPSRTRIEVELEQLLRQVLELREAAAARDGKTVDESALPLPQNVEDK